MKLNHLKILGVAAAFPADSGLCFVPSHFILKPCTRSVGVSEIRVTGPLFSTPQGDVPLDTKAIIAAYEEWRRKFGKGDFDIRRFHNFENNYRVLTAANIKAKDKSLAEGKTPPRWLELNEYGDYARDEYKAMLEKGELQPPSTASGAASVRRTQVIVPPKAGSASAPPPNQRAQVLTQDPSKQIGLSYGTQVLRKTNQGKTPAQLAVPPKASTGVSSLYRPPSTTTGTTSTEQSGSPSFGTQVVRKDVQSAPSVGDAQVSGVNDLFGPPRSSIPPPSADSPAPGISGAQVVQQVGDAAPRGTQVVSAFPAGGTGAWSGAPWSNSQPAPRGTQVISKVPPTTSSVNGLYGPPPSVSGTAVPAPRGTQVIQRASDRAAPRGTQLVSGAPASGNTKANLVVDERGTFVIQRNAQADGPTPRGTQVIPQESPAIGDFMNSSREFVANRGTQVIREATKRTGALMESSGGSDMIRQFSDKVSKSIFSLFGGQKSDDEDPRSVRGTVQIRGDGDDTEGKKTVLVDMAGVQQKIPSIFSFFGGSKTEETVAEDVAPAPVTVPPKAPGRPTLVIDRNFVEFPGVEGLPELRRWWQAADGTITGFIYNSKNFNDGTKLTSSKLQRASCKAGNILRSGGEDYLLK